ncbi:hypothetical protein CC1G_07840 [Coprinopsis cinerea okayama7|uniref:DUF2415 domain-containing protein n=1 Tax=Coprinopsis cinerea (strain Okayama-7 / 130 / ATCC MYA-4618 / FGSC 9003) TaxID=240176 RepID=A8P406_COPC7|nr:hypothetical protein CC1G_07840 [Coprinopsis cinerea okayama7\|eukprot:XP_001838649.1 hypothetical protein CC1G_07840 [Coprinopsis cinerea okayama7\
MAATTYVTAKPTAVAQAQITIDHPQLRDLIVCPQEQGVVTYVRDREIVEQNLNLPNAPIRTLVRTIMFPPSSLTAMALGNNNEDTLLAAGGSWEANLHLSYHQPSGAAPLWQYNCRLSGTLNNSVLLTRSNSSSCEPRVGVTNNDQTFRLYDCAIRRQPLDWRPTTADDHIDRENWQDERLNNARLECVGALKLDTCINYASMSPSGRMIATVGDSGNVYLHHVSGSSRVTYRPVATIPLPLPANTPPHYPTTRPSTFTAAFAAAWSKDGSKYAVGSQEGVVGVWDIRSTKPLKVFQVDKMRGMGAGGLGASPAGWISWDPSHWFVNTAPSWSVRNVKFGGDENGLNETLVFAEHTSLIHLVDGKTFEEEAVIHVPTTMSEPPPPSPPIMSVSDPLDAPLDLIHLDLPPVVNAISTYTYSFNPVPDQVPIGLPPGAYSMPLWDDESSDDDDDNDDNDQDEQDHHSPTPVPQEVPQASASPSTPPVPERIPARLPNSTIFNGYRFSSPEFEYEEDLHIAGVCFSPTGKSLYVGTTQGVVEYGMVDRRQRGLS